MTAPKHFLSCDETIFKIPGCIGIECPITYHGNELLCKAASSGDIDALVEANAKDSWLSVSARIKNQALDEACAHGHHSVVDLLLKIVNPFHDLQGPLVNACMGGHVNVIDTLLLYKRVDPSHGTGSTTPLIYAIDSGNVGAVFRLLQDHRVDPDANEGEALVRACSTNAVEMVAMLLETGRVCAGTNDSLALCVSCMNGNAGSVLVLLGEESSGPAADNSQCMIQAVTGGHWEVIEMLLKDGRADPATIDNKPIRIACKLGHFLVVWFLIQSKRIDPQSRDNQPLLLAVKGNHHMIVKLLLDLEGEEMDLSSREEDLKNAMKNNGDIAMAELVFSHKSFADTKDARMKEMRISLKKKPIFEHEPPDGKWISPKRHKYDV